MRKVILKTGREKSLLRRHPWVFSGAIREGADRASPGETVRIVTQQGECMALGSYSPHSQIRLRIWTFDPKAVIDGNFFKRRIERALRMRRRILGENISTLRLVNAESDGLPGLVVDKYGGFLVCQFLSAGAEFYKKEIVEQLKILFEPSGIYERSDTESRKKEGLSESVGLLYGCEPPEFIEVERNNVKFLVDVRHGHKTGMYLDQTENREIVRKYANAAEVLNCFSYTGAFSLAALCGGAARVTNIESSADAIEMITRNINLNGYDISRTINIQGDAFQVLRELRDSGKKYDLVILDPPKFVHTVQQLQRGCRGYKDINLLAMKLVNVNGILITFSCSGHLSMDLFQKVIADAALDAGRSATLVHVLGQPVDHPVPLNFPEGRYLKGLVCYLD